MICYDFIIAMTRQWLLVNTGLWESMLQTDCGPSMRVNYGRYKRASRCTKLFIKINDSNSSSPLSSICSHLLPPSPHREAPSHLTPSNFTILKAHPLSLLDNDHLYKSTLSELNFGICLSRILNGMSASISVLLFYFSPKRILHNHATLIKYNRILVSYFGLYRVKCPLHSYKHIIAWLHVLI